MSNLAPGTIVGGRFALVGELGTGGTATVWLAVDQLRGERVALKVVHAHLAGDPSVRRRLQREVAAATLLRHEAALVPWDLHALDGLLCLTLPYHPGQTLTEHVAAAGPLPIERVRALGIRVGSALAAAHRSGLLHRDVTANNVLLEPGGDAVITDFGLSRAQSDGTKSTGVLGTAGYAAPEVYAGSRADPRADLYGLGCALYLALTGRTPFGTDAPMAVLQRQLSDGFTPIRELRPDCPEELARTVEALIRKDAAARPQGASALVDALTAREPAEAARPTPIARPADPGRRVHLPPGPWVVVVRERDDDRSRRRGLRKRLREARSEARPVGSPLHEHFRKQTVEFANGLMAFLRLDPSAPTSRTPEDLLADAVAREGGVPATDLQRPLALYEPRFVLAEGVAADAAAHLVGEARSLGFKAHRIDTSPQGEASVWGTVATAAMVVGWMLTFVVPEATGIPFLAWVAFMVAFTMIRSRLFRNPTADRGVAELPVAFRADLGRALTREIPGRFVIEAQAAEPQAPAATPAVEPAPRTRAQGLADRALGQIDGLERTIAELDLPVAAASDLRDSARDLRERAVDLAASIERLDAELSVEADDAGWIAPRLHRLQTKQRAGEPVDRAEITRLELALRAQEQAELARATLESQLTSHTASLLEIGATAARVRRELLQEDPSRTAPEALDRLRREARATDDARREMAGHARSQRAREPR